MHTNISELQALTIGDSSIKIAVLDGSVDLKHPCFNASEGKLIASNSAEVKPSAIDSSAK